jgi:hypothetical protein
MYSSRGLNHKEASGRVLDTIALQQLHLDAISDVCLSASLHTAYMMAALAGEAKPQVFGWHVSNPLSQKRSLLATPHNELPSYEMGRGAVWTLKCGMAWRIVN